MPCIRQIDIKTGQDIKHVLLMHNRVGVLVSNGRCGRFTFKLRRISHNSLLRLTGNLRRCIDIIMFIVMPVCIDI